MLEEKMQKSESSQSLTTTTYREKKGEGGSADKTTHGSDP